MSRVIAVMLAALACGAFAVAAEAAGKSDPRVCAQATPGGKSQHAYWCAKAAAKQAVATVLEKRTGATHWYYPVFCDQVSGGVLRWRCAVIAGGPYATVTVRFKTTRAGWRAATSIVCAKPGATPANGCKR